MSRMTYAESVEQKTCHNCGEPSPYGEPLKIADYLMVTRSPKNLAALAWVCPDCCHGIEMDNLSFEDSMDDA